MKQSVDRRQRSEGSEPNCITDTRVDSHPSLKTRGDAGALFVPTLGQEVSMTAHCLLEKSADMTRMYSMRAHVFKLYFISKQLCNTTAKVLRLSSKLVPHYSVNHFTLSCSPVLLLLKGR